MPMFIYFHYLAEQLGRLFIKKTSESYYREKAFHGFSNLIQILKADLCPFCHYAGVWI